LQGKLNLHDVDYRPRYFHQVKGQVQCFSMQFVINVFPKPRKFGADPSSQKTHTERQNGSAPIFFQDLEKTLVHYNLHWKALHPVF